MLMISLTSVTKRFRNTLAVEKISFKARQGEIIGFLGVNGAGKTTTMRLLLGYLNPTSGKISIDNLDPLKDRVQVLRNVGYLPENNPLYQEMKVNEYLAFIASVKGATIAQDTVDQIGLQEVMQSKIENLSRGYKQRVGLVAALVGNPQILILDEPTSGLDPIEQEKIRKLIKKLSSNKTIIFSTHILSEVEDIATRLVIIHRGRIVYDGKKPKGRGGVEKLFKKLVK